MALERQVICNRIMDTGEQVEQRFTWRFVVICEKGKAEEIQSRALRFLAPASDLTVVNYGLIESSGGLHASYFSFQSSQPKLDLETRESIYKSPNFSYDPELRPLNDVQLGEYIGRVERETTRPKKFKTREHMKKHGKRRTKQ